MNITPSQMLVKVGYGTIHFSTVLKRVDRIHMVKAMHFVCISVLEFKCDWSKIVDTFVVILSHMLYS